MVLVRDDQPTSGAGVTVAAAPEATGRVFVRFADGQRAADATAQLRAAGYEIERTLSWAPNALWVRPAPDRDGRATDPEAGLHALARIPGVVKVEPELLRPRAHKE